MNILASEINIPQRALEIYVAGCTRKCPGCHNPETWDFNQGTPWRDWWSRNKHKLSSGLLRYVWVLGGEPLDQDHTELKGLLRALTGYPVLLWTSYTTYPAWVPVLCWGIKTGEYRNDLPPKDVQGPLKLTLASSNQEILIFR